MSIKCPECEDVLKARQGRYGLFRYCPNPFCATDIVKSQVSRTFHVNEATNNLYTRDGEDYRDFRDHH